MYHRFDQLNKAQQAAARIQYEDESELFETNEIDNYLWTVDENGQICGRLFVGSIAGVAPSYPTAHYQRPFYQSCRNGRYAAALLGEDIGAALGALRVEAAQQIGTAAHWVDADNLAVIRYQLMETLAHLHTNSPNPSKPGGPVYLLGFGELVGIEADYNWFNFEPDDPVYVEGAVLYMVANTETAVYLRYPRRGEEKFQ